MNTTQPDRSQQAQDLFGRQIAQRLSAGTQELPHDICERLRAARVRSLSRRRVEVAMGVRTRAPALAGAPLLAGERQGLNLWGRLASALPMLVLAAGLVAITLIQDERRASELAEVDAALLIDDLPPAAYADAGFVQFLKSER